MKVVKVWNLLFQCNGPEDAHFNYHEQSLGTLELHMLPLTEDRAQQYFKLIKPHFSTWVIYKGRFETLAPLYLYVTPPDIFPIELHKTSGIKFENQKNDHLKQELSNFLCLVPLMKSKKSLAPMQKKF
jgi:hypothetical protein